MVVQVLSPNWIDIGKGWCVDTKYVARMELSVVVHCDGKQTHKLIILMNDGTEFHRDGEGVDVERVFQDWKNTPPTQRL